MKTERNIFIAFILNITFSIFEFIGGLFTNSVAILSDSVHDLGDAFSIGLSYYFEKKSKKPSDNKYTYGYVRYSVLGGVITTVILLVGSILVIIGSVKRLFNPVSINYDGMIIFAIISTFLNLIAAYVTREGDSINQKAVNLHMLEDVLGWIIVLIGAVVMKFTDIRVLDSIMSIGVSIFILINAMKNLKMVLDIFLGKTPDNTDIEVLKEKRLEIKGIDDIHHIHVWSMDGFKTLATMHIVTKSKDIVSLKKEIRSLLEKCNICHAILETEDEACDDKECFLDIDYHHHH